MSNSLPPTAPARPLADFDAYLFDADGTLWHGRQALAGAAEVVDALKRRGRRVGMVSNNSMLSVAGLSQRLRDLAIDIVAEEVVSAPLATATHIARERPAARVYAFGSDELREQLAALGLRMETDPKHVDYIVIGLDRLLNYEKLNTALHAARNGARIVALNQDRVSVDEHGLYPGAGMIVGAVRGMTGRDPDVVIGKPSPYLLTEAAARLGVAAANCLFIGDYLETDILAANRAAMASALVLTGVSQVADIERSAATPDYVIADLVELHRHVGRA